VVRNGTIGTKTEGYGRNESIVMQDKVVYCFQKNISSCSKN